MTRPFYAREWRKLKGHLEKIADHLGIDKVDGETDLRQMYDFVQGIGKEDDDDKPEYTPTPLPEDPYAGGGGDRPGIGRPGFGGGKGNVPGSIQYKPPSDDSELGRAISSVADYGNRGTDDYFGRFLPEMGSATSTKPRPLVAHCCPTSRSSQAKSLSWATPRNCSTSTSARSRTTSFI